MWAKAATVKPFSIPLRASKVGSLHDFSGPIAGCPPANRNKSTWVSEAPPTNSSKSSESLHMRLDLIEHLEPVRISSKPVPLPLGDRQRMP